MHALARLATERDEGPLGRARTRIRTLRPDWPLMLRTTMPAVPAAVAAWTSRHATAADVHLAAGAAGPVGGDRLRLRIDVGPGSALALGDISATLLLPGPHGEESVIEADIRVGAYGTLAWLPELVIAAQGCRHRTVVRIALGPGARLLLREEVLFGRHGERPGDFRQRIRVEAGGRALYDQEFAAGPSAPGWDGPAVTAGHGSAGSLLLVDPGVSRDEAGAAARPTGREDTAVGTPLDTSVMPLSGSGTLVSALAPDTASLRRRLDGALAPLLARADGSRGPVETASPGRAMHSAPDAAPVSAVAPAVPQP
ncbi:MAG TPA: urease accessory protein [Streptomyces sp.]|nr:urease accessory protein [Streptomyces sp.]